MLKEFNLLIIRIFKVNISGNISTLANCTWCYIIPATSCI